ncbi:MAG: 4Fe-4S binding protein [Desulfovibrionaceae bacterium]
MLNVLGRSFSCLALLLLGAHALRLGFPGTSGACLGLCVMAWLDRSWMRWVILAVLAVGGAIWGNVLAELIRFRLDSGLPWARLALVMGGVVLLNVTAFGLVLRRFVHEGHDRKPPYVWGRAVVFLLTAGLLFISEVKTDFPLLLVERYLPGWGGLEIFGLALYAQWVFVAMQDPAQSRTVRPRIWGLFSTVFFLQLLLGLMGLDRMLMTGTLHLPVPALIVGGPVFRGDGLFMPILFLVTVALVGPAWCSHLCYIGAWDDVCSRLGAKRPAAGVPGKAVYWGRAVTLILTVLVALTMRLFGVPGGMAIWAAVGFGLLGVAVMVLLSRRSGSMVHCSAYCPMGLVANLLGRLTPWRMRLGGECIHCGVCALSCRYGALSDADIKAGRPGLSCTLCGDCVGICPQKTMRYHFFTLSQDASRVFFLLLVCILHAVFLGVARI